MIESVCISSSDMATTAAWPAASPEVPFWGTLRDAGRFEQLFAPSLAPSERLIGLRILAECRFSGLCLRHPIEIVVQWDEEQCLVTTSQIDTYGAGETEHEAIADFLSSLAFDYTWLLENKETLAPRLAKQLDTLKSLLCPIAD